MSQDITLNLIVLNQQGKPQLILEPKPQAYPFGERQSSTEMSLPAQNDDATSFSEIIHRQPQHVGGVTLDQIMKKEHAV